MSGNDVVVEAWNTVPFDKFERFDTDIRIGRDLDEAVEFAIALGPAGEIVRLAGADGVWAPSSTWFITVRNPG